VLYESGCMSRRRSGMQGQYDGAGNLHVRCWVGNRTSMGVEDGADGVRVFGEGIVFPRVRGEGFNCGVG